jgi:hypothetical protein
MESADTGVINAIWAKQSGLAASCLLGSGLAVNSLQDVL